MFVNSDMAKEFRDTASLYGELLDTAVIISPSDGRNWKSAGSIDALLVMGDCNVGNICVVGDGVVMV